MLSPQFPAVNIPSLQKVDLPAVARIRLKQPSAPAIADIEAGVRQALEGADRLRALAPGSRVALAVGSRGIAHIDRLARAVVGWLREQRLEPFIVPAMGSHGGGTAEGQAAVLARLGVDEQRTGAPVRATMEVVECGRTAKGVPCFFDANAHAADAVVIIGRVKSHTSFDRPIESGLTKMVGIGLGKQEGARNIHRMGPYGLSEVLPEMASVAIANSPLAYGLAIVENAAHEIVTIEGAEPAAFADTDIRLLKKAKSLLARLPVRKLDVLACQELGKEVSGAGMDYAVIGRTDIRGIANPDHIEMVKLVVLRLTEATHGNGIGIGVADYVPKTLTDGLDLKSMYENAITSALGEKCRIPIVLPSERETLQAAFATCWNTDPASWRYCQIRNTLSLDEVLVSRPVMEELGASGTLEPLEFDDKGRLLTIL
ncbi:MAG: lactate racemase domain-containing protein [Geminicoccaceae bacterium]